MSAGAFEPSAGGWRIIIGRTKSAAMKSRSSNLHVVLGVLLARTSRSTPAVLTRSSWKMIGPSGVIAA